MELDQKISDKLYISRQILYAIIFTSLAREIILNPGWYQNLTQQNSLLTGLFFLAGIGIVFTSIRSFKQKKLQTWQKILTSAVIVAAILFCAAVLIQIGLRINL